MNVFSSKPTSVEKSMGRHAGNKTTHQWHCYNKIKRHDELCVKAFQAEILK